MFHTQTCCDSSSHSGTTGGSPSGEGAFFTRRSRRVRSSHHLLLRKQLMRGHVDGGRAHNPARVCSTRIPRNQVTGDLAKLANAPDLKSGPLRVRFPWSPPGCQRSEWREWAVHRLNTDRGCEADELALEWSEAGSTPARALCWCKSNPSVVSVAVAQRQRQRFQTPFSASSTLARHTALYTALVMF